MSYYGNLKSCIAELELSHEQHRQTIENAQKIQAVFIERASRLTAENQRLREWAREARATLSEMAQIHAPLDSAEFIKAARLLATYPTDEDAGD